MRVLIAPLNLHTPFLRVFNFGAAALSAYLKKAGHTVQVVEVNREPELPLLEAAIRRFAPDVVGMNGAANQAPYFPRVVRVARAAAPSAKVLIGGWHATLCPQKTLRESGADAVCAGEGELALSAYLDDLAAGGDGRRAPNFCFKNGDTVVRNPPAPFIQDLDSLPMFDYDCVDYQGILDVNLGVPYLVAGRGCPWKCTFCSVGTMGEAGTGEYSRMRSAANVIREIEYLAGRFKVEYLYFRDDTFTWNREWVFDFCGRMAAGPRIPFEILTRSDCLDQDVVDALEKGGCACVWIGIDSGDLGIRNGLLNKTTSWEQDLAAADRLHKAGITVMTTNMVGLPGETPEKFWRTVEINRRIYRDRLAVSRATGSGPKIFVFGPFPGTPLHDECIRSGWMPDYPCGYEIYRDSFMEMPAFTRKQIMSAYRDFRFNVYRPSFPVRAWLYRAWDHRIGAFMISNPLTRTLLQTVIKVAKPLVAPKQSRPD